MKRGALALAIAALFGTGLQAEVCNLKVVTDASPDYSDMDSLVHSITGNWATDKEKMWALFYWNHIARRQTNPIGLHGKAETDPIRQFNDYGFTMCSTISGIQMAIYQHMGYKAKYYDISLHTVSEVFYDNAYHHYDNSLSVYYTLCDGKTVAGIEDVGKELACDASGGKAELGHVAMYHAVHGTGPDGFLEGADTPRDLRHLGDYCFKPEVLKYRYYFNDAELGHRYILNLRDNEVYTRYYTRLDAPKEGGKSNYATGTPDHSYFTPNGKDKNGNPKDPESANFRYHIRGNGERTFEPQLTEAALLGSMHSGKNVKALNPGLQPSASGEAEAIFKIEGANVITSTKIAAELLKASAEDQASISISTNNGMTWKEVYKAEAQGPNKADVKLIDDVNGAYEVLVKVAMQAKSQPSDVQLKSIKFNTITQVNSKTQPKLNLGKNTVYVGAGDQTESIVLWPDLQGDAYKSTIAEESNIKTKKEHEGWNAVMNPAEKGEEGYVVFKIDAPQDITSITQGARMYVRNPKSSISFEHSFDGGKTWKKSYTLDDTEQPWDDIQNQITKDIPAGTKSVLFKYVLNKAGLYSVRMEANHKVADASAKPVEVTFNWSERQQDRSLVKRSHTQLVEKLPSTYTLNVGGFDHPIVDSLTVNLKGARSDVKYGYSDDKDAGGEKWIGNWVTYGKNFAQGKPYTISVPSETQWEAGDPDLKKLTDGRVGSSYSGGTTYREGPLWKKGTTPEINVDLGEKQKAKAFRIHIHGYPWQDAMKGQVTDQVEVLVSDDGKEYKSVGNFDFNLYWKNIPVNYMYTDEETFAGHNHLLLLDQPVDARFVQFKVKPGRMLVVSEVQVLDGIKSEPFDLKVALPK